MNKMERILNFIRDSDNGFIPKLSARVSIDAFVDKLIANGVVILDETDNEIDGIIAGYNNNINAYISYLFVKTDMRGLGKSKHLINEFIKCAKISGSQKIQLTVRKDSPAYHLYSKMGFKEVERFDYNDNQTSGYLMELVL